MKSEYMYEFSVVSALGDNISVDDWFITGADYETCKNQVKTIIENSGRTVLKIDTKGHNLWIMES